jgi:hypothetical protein
VTYALSAVNPSAAAACSTTRSAASSATAASARSGSNRASRSSTRTFTKSLRARPYVSVFAIASTIASTARL